MQKLSGNGIAFAEFDGHVIEYNLQPGQQIVIDTGHLAAMSGTCQMDVKTVPGVKNIFFSGEGVFNTVVTGPGECGYRLCLFQIWQVVDAISSFNNVITYLKSKSCESVK